jgi:hypothetical protein
MNPIGLEMGCWVRPFLFTIESIEIKGLRRGIPDHRSPIPGFVPFHRKKPRRLDTSPLLMGNYL